MADKIGKLVIFRGRVQGVGFRRTAWHIAKGFVVAGFARNEPDGSVTVLVEGSSDEVNKFLARLQETMRAEIQAVESSACEPNHRASFEIVY